MTGRPPDNLTGRLFGRLTVLELAARKPVRWRCRCKCGNERTVAAYLLARGRTKSCGCLKIEWIAQARAILVKRRAGQPR